MRNSVLTPIWEEGHAAAMRGDDVEFSNVYSGDDRHEFQIGFECGRHDLRLSLDRVEKTFPPPDRCAERIGIPLESWPGNCFAIATALVESGIVRGRAVYGAYLGPIAPGTLFSNRPGGMTNHGWIETPDGHIVDPTRWVFSGTAPRLAVLLQGNDEYDEGATARAAKFRQPFPAATSPAKVQTSVVAARELRVQGVVPPPALTMAQVGWLANTPPQNLGGSALELYAWLDSVNCASLVPLDFRQRAAARTPKSETPSSGPTFG